MGYGMTGGMPGSSQITDPNSRVNQDLRTEVERKAAEAADQRRADFLMPGYQERQDRLLGLAGDMQGRSAPQAQGATLGRAALAAESGFRDDQSALVDMLRRQAAGQDSMAALQAREANNRAIAQQQALAASARPGQAALAARMQAQNIGRLQQGLAAQEAQARLAERLGATQALGSVLQGARGQDMQNSQFNASALNAQALERARMLQQNNQFNVGAQMQQTGMNDQALLELLRQELANAGGQQQGAMGYQSLEEQRRQHEASQPSTWDKIAGVGMGVLNASMMGK